MKYIDSENLMKFPMPFKFDPPPACRCRSGLAACAASTHARIKKKKNVTFLSPARIFSEVFAPLCLPFLLKPLPCQAHIIFS